MHVSDVTSDTLRHLAELETAGRPVISLYLDLDPRRFPTPDTRSTELSALLADAERQATRYGAHAARVVAQDTSRLRALVEGDSAILGAARSVAIFSSGEADVLEIVRLRDPVEPTVAVGDVPWLAPLAAARVDGSWGVLVTSRRTARVLRVDRAGAQEIERIDDDVHGRHDQGGWSQARFARGIEQEVAWHVAASCEALRRAHDEQAFVALVLAAPEELRPVLREHLDPEQRSLVAGWVAVDERATVEDVERAVRVLQRERHAARERALLDRLDHELGTGGNGAAGLDDVLSVLEQRSVATLLIVEGARLDALVCPRCGRLSATGDTCPIDGAPLAPADVAARAIASAIRHGGEVVAVRQDRAGLERRGSIAALLRH
jgi:peptide chain release factor subunit 1